MFVAGAGCSPEPPTEIAAIYQVHADLDRENPTAWAVFRADDLADHADEVMFSVDGTERPLRTSSEKTLTSRTDTPRRAAGEAYEFALDLSWQDPRIVSLPMPAGAELESPADGATIHVQDGLTLMWSGGPTDAGESVFISFPGAFSSFETGFRHGFQDTGALGSVKATEEGIHIPFEELSLWFDELAECLAAAECRETDATPHVLEFPIAVEISVWRSSLLDEVPGFQQNGSLASVAIELARISVVLAE
jgi:hypothetical protein